MSTWSNVLLAIGVCSGMLVLMELGRSIGVRRARRDPEGARQGAGMIDGAVFSLLGLLVAFTFSGAADRFDERRDLIVDETNAIGTAYLRLDLVPAARDDLRAQFRAYVDSRLEVYAALPDRHAAASALARSAQIQNQIWDRAVVAVRDEPPYAASLLLAALNEMIDITTTRAAAAHMHPPTIIYVMLVLLALVSALLAGVGMCGGKHRNWLHLAAYAVGITITLFVILDFEHPRFGLLRVDGFDQMLVDLRASMH